MDGVRDGCVLLGESGDGSASRRFNTRLSDTPIERSGTRRPANKQCHSRLPRLSHHLQTQQGQLTPIIVAQTSPLDSPHPLCRLQLVLFFILVCYPRRIRLRGPRPSSASKRHDSHAILITRWRTTICRWILILNLVKSIDSGV